MLEMKHLPLVAVTLSFFFFSSRRRHTRCLSDWSSDVCSSDLPCRRRICVSRSRTIASSSTTSNVLVGSDILAGGGNSEVASESMGSFRGRADWEGFMSLLSDLMALSPSELNQARVDGQPHKPFRPTPAPGAIGGSNEVTKRQRPLSVIGFHGHCPRLARRGPTPSRFA